MFFKAWKQRVHRKQTPVSSSTVTFQSKEEVFLTHAKDVILKMLAQASSLTQTIQRKLQDSSTLEEILYLYRDYYLEKRTNTWTNEQEYKKLQVYMDKKQIKMIEKLNQELQEKQKKICELVSAYQEAREYFMQEVDELKETINRLTRENKSLRESKQSMERATLMEKYHRVGGTDNMSRKNNSLNTSFNHDSPIEMTKMKHTKMNKELSQNNLFEIEKFIQSQKSVKAKKNFCFPEPQTHKTEDKNRNFLMNEINLLKKNQSSLIDSLQKRDQMIKDLMNIIQQNDKDAYQGIYE